MKESLIQQLICEYLSLSGFFYFSIPNEGIMSVLKIFKIPDKLCYSIINFFKKMGLVPGIPDLCLIVGFNEVIYLEVKNEKGTVSKNQKIIHSILQKKGFKVFIVRSVEDVINIIVKYKYV